MAYSTVQACAEDEFTEQRSRFIGYIAPVSSEQQAMEFIGGIKAKHRDATHNVFAYTLQNGQIRRCSDDGEPSGTAGAPVLDVILKEGLTDVAVVVTRYFGGILLGAGGLARAYSHAAKLAVNAAQRVEMTECILLSLTMAYNWYAQVQRVLPRYNAQVQGSDFAAEVGLTVLIRAERAQAFVEELTELSAATIRTEMVLRTFGSIA